MSSDWHLQPATTLAGRVLVPGDKSVGHRAIMFAGLADGDSRVGRLSTGRDVSSTASVMAQLGVAVRLDAAEDGLELRARGGGVHSLTPPAQALDCGNSGTTLRLVAGIVAGYEFASVLTGDASLRSRPMARIAEPLRVMGAHVETAEGSRAPLRIHGGRLRGLTHRPPVASAQVKSCILLAGLAADGATTVVERSTTRDHTERMLAAMGADVRRDGEAVTLEPPVRLDPLIGELPGDVSSAAYLLAAASIVEGARLELPAVGVNPTRRSIIDLLSRWGADLHVSKPTSSLGEPCADLVVGGVGRELTGGLIDAEAVPGLIDELPLLGLLGPFTRDGVEVRGAAELRVKESDRIATTCAAVRALGGQVEEYPDGFAVAGDGPLAGGIVDASGDHRIALAAAAVSVACRGDVVVVGGAAADVSFPGFERLLQTVCER